MKIRLSGDEITIHKEKLYCPSCDIKTEHEYEMFKKETGYWKCLNCNYHQSQTEKFEEMKIV